MNRRNFFSAVACVAMASLVGSSVVVACPCKGIERLTTDKTSSYTFTAGRTKVTVPLFKMTDKQAVDYANGMCAEHRTCKVYIVKSTKGDFYGVFTVEDGTITARVAGGP